MTASSVTSDTAALAHEPGGNRHPVRRRPDLLGRGTAVGYTGAFREAGGVDIQDFVTAQLARGSV